MGTFDLLKLLCLMNQPCLSFLRIFLLFDPWLQHFVCPTYNSNLIQNNLLGGLLVSPFIQQMCIPWHFHVRSRPYSCGQSLNYLRKSYMRGVTKEISPVWWHIFFREVILSCDLKNQQESLPSDGLRGNSTVARRDSMYSLHM